MSTSIVTILHGETEFIPLILDNFKNFIKHEEKDSLELFIIDDGKEDLKNYFSEIENCNYINLSEKQKQNFMKHIEEEYTLPNKSYLYYEKKKKSLPNGFLRDYGCGMSNNENIFHMNADCIYNPKSIQRKSTFMKKVGADCIYCDTTLCYDIYGKELYKTISPFKIYESTLYHSREFWRRRGFQWSDTENEGKYFHYDNGIDRKMDNYYDTIQLLSIHNINQYKPVKVTIDGIKIKIPDIISEIIIEGHPFKKYINDLFPNKVNILGLESEFLMNIDIDNHWEINNITDKWKQTKLAKEIKEINNSFNVLLYCSKNPAWDLFKHIPFDIIILETPKNYEQMTSIILTNKVHEYIQVKGLFIRKEFLEN